MPSTAPTGVSIEGIDLAKVPSHVAIIMDGNGRWAKKRGMPRVAGHKAGVESVREAVRTCRELGIGVLTLYAFSTENWLRPAEEVSEIMRLLCWVLRHEVRELGKNGVRLRVSGRLEALPEDVRKELHRSIDALKDNRDLTLNLALNYGSRQEIIDAIHAALADGVQTFTEEILSKYLYTAGLPDPDLVIRTSGEMRLSNFLLWQIAYSELYITPILWPEFRRPHMIEAVAEYQKRNRRFGGI